MDGQLMPLQSPPPPPLRDYLLLVSYNQKKRAKWFHDKTGDLGEFPYYELECLNKKWAKTVLPSCIKRSCGLQIPTAWQVCLLTGITWI